MLQFVSLAVGRSLTGQHIFRRCRVLLLSFEDDRDELRRRIAAELMRHRVNRGDLKEWFFYATPKGLKLAEMREGSRQIGALEKWLRDKINLLKPDVVGLDLFVKLHALEGNDTGQMDFVCDLLTRLAIEYDIAVDAPHHTRKGQLAAGDADSGRGASSIRDAGRLVYTLTRMNEDEAKQFSISEDQRRSYVRLDNAKVNIAPNSQKATWFKLVGVRLGNGTEEYPDGDEVQTIEPWAPPDTWANLSTATLNTAWTEIDAGMENGQRYSGAPAAGKRAAWPVVQRNCPDKTDQQCREIVKKWVLSGLLYYEEYYDPVERKDRKGLHVDSAKRPG